MGEFVRTSYQLLDLTRQKSIGSTNAVCSQTSTETTTASRWPNQRLRLGPSAAERVGIASTATLPANDRLRSESQARFLRR